MPRDIATFFNCNAARRLLEKAIKPPTNNMVPADFYDVRDYGLLRLILMNAQRPAAIRSITERAFEEAHRSDDGWFSIAVSHCVRLRFSIKNV